MRMMDRTVTLLPHPDLSDQSEGAAVRDGQADAVQGLDHPFVGVEIGDQVLCFNQCGHAC